MVVSSRSFASFISMHKRPSPAFALKSRVNFVYSFQLKPSLLVEFEQRVVKMKYDANRTLENIIIGINTTENLVSTNLVPRVLTRSPRLDWMQLLYFLMGSYILQFLTNTPWKNSFANYILLINRLRKFTDQPTPTVGRAHVNIFPRCLQAQLLKTPQFLHNKDAVSTILTEAFLFQLSEIFPSDDMDFATFLTRAENDASNVSVTCFWVHSFAWGIFN